MELVSERFVDIIALVAILVGLILAAWWIIAVHWLHSREVEQEIPNVEMPEGVQEAMSGVPPALVVFYAFFAVSLIGYVLYIWLGGISY